MLLPGSTKRRCSASRGLFLALVVAASAAASVAATIEKAAVPIPLGATQCVTCTMGKYSDQPAQAMCKLCPPGYFSSGRNASLQCKECPYGSYSDTYGSATCTLCPQGKTTVNNPSGAQACVCCLLWNACAKMQGKPDLRDTQEELPRHWPACQTVSYFPSVHVFVACVCCLFFFCRHLAGGFEGLYFYFA